jgi:predicted hotdog family 3-hydroxylacyl-ACP dehydratase
MLNHREIEALIPHKGTMCLLERVLSWDETQIRLSTRTHSNIANPLRSELGLRAIHLCEYGAQAMAVHGALLAQRQGHAAIAKPGMLISLRAIKLQREFIQDLPNDLIVTAKALHTSDTLLQYLFAIHHEESQLAEGRAAVALQVPGSTEIPVGG